MIQTINKPEDWFQTPIRTTQNKTHAAHHKQTKIINNKCFLDDTTFSFVHHNITNGMNQIIVASNKSQGVTNGIYMKHMITRDNIYIIPCVSIYICKIIRNVP